MSHPATDPTAPDRPHATAGPASSGKPRRRRLRRIAAWLFFGSIAGWVAGCSPIVAYDIVTNLGSAPHDPALQAEPDRPRLVVLAHGMLRSTWSMWRLERALEAHGYEVFNFGYPSTRTTIDRHAHHLAADLEDRLAKYADEHPEEPLPQIDFVAHSMGGLVVRAYLQLPDARPAMRCVFIATPHRGAAAAKHYSTWWLYSAIMGNQAARQLIPGDPFYESLQRLTSPYIGCIYGGKGDDEGYSRNIPGDDDRAVGVAEAQLPEQTDAVQVKTSHTRIKVADEPIRQVLHFLRHERFDHPDD